MEHNPLHDFGGDIQGQSSVPEVVGYQRKSPLSPPEEKKSHTGDRAQWLPMGDNLFTSCGRTQAVLECGVYAPAIVDNRPALRKMKSTVDELLNFPDSTVDNILTDIKEFWSREELFKKHKFLHRRGYMFYGPHGSGKSSLVQQIIAQVVVQGDGLVILCDSHPDLLGQILVQLREVEPRRPLVCVFEDLDAIIKKYGDSALLSILDGENQVDRVLNIATTNYPEYLDPRLLSRPRRFDRVIMISWPSADVRSYYFKHKLNLDDSELDTWVKASDKFSFASCAELVISVKCLGKDFAETVSKLRQLTESKPNSKEYEVGAAKAGFAK